MMRINAHSLELYRGNQWHTYDEQRLGLPYGLTLSQRDKEPFSPPSSPREPGEEEEEQWRYYGIFRIYGARYMTYFWVNPYYPRTIKQKKTSKGMRRNGRLKQPGGASCNQRR